MVTNLAKNIISKILAALMIVSLALGVLSVRPVYANACAWTGATNTTWATASNWSGCGGVAPQATDTVVIPDAATTLNDPTVTNAVVTIAGFTIDSGGVVNDGGSSTRLTVNGPVVLNGTWNGAGRLLLNAGAATLDGSGTFNGNRIDPVSGARTILSTANLTVTRIDVRANNTVTNYGSVTATTITGNDATTAIWINEANSTLKVSGELFDTKPGTLTATANPNTVEYNGAVQTVEPATYHHLILSGSGAKTAGRVVTTNGNLTVITA